MIRINLLPIRTQLKKERSKHFVITYLLSVVLILSAIGYVWNRQSREISRLERRESRLRIEKARFSQYDQLLKKLKAEKAVIDKKRKIIRDLQRDRDRMVRALALLSVCVPVDKIWFDRLSISNGRANIAGTAVSNEAIAEFLRNLESSPYVVAGSVNLSHSRRKVVGERKLREFKISCRVLAFSQVKARLERERSLSGPGKGKKGAGA